MNAGKQIHKCFEKLKKHHMVIPCLHVMSVMGTMFATYKLDKATKHMTPVEILHVDENNIKDLALQPSGCDWRGHSMRYT